MVGGLLDKTVQTANIQLREEHISGSKNSWNLPGRSSAARTTEAPGPRAEGSYATSAKLCTGWRKTT